MSKDKKPPAVNESTPPAATTAPAAAPEELAALAGAAAAADAAADPVLDPAAPPKPEPVMPTDMAMVMLLSPLFATLAPNWNIEKSEIEQLAKVYGAVVDKYFPGGIILGPEISAVMLTLAIFGPRIGKPRKIEAPKAEPAPKDAPASPAMPKPEVVRQEPFKNDGT